MAKKTKKPSIKKSVRVITNNARRPARLHMIQDNRLFSPTPLVQREIRRINITPVIVKSRPNIRKRGTSAFLSIPRSAIICARRKIRKEVIFAKNKGGSGNRRPKFNENSQLHCR